MWYSIGRFFIEALRTDSLMLGNFKVAQLMSVLLFIIGLILLLVGLKGSKFENRYDDYELEDIKF
ncbi:MAG TPA: prolipoprotein diacylglyceryl transferase, partial [Bacilli bacterium]|nr:prolipoprotein diacylglyceryl transferase [Bacilli bacterium]